jgi:hypothetical protein
MDINEITRAAYDGDPVEFERNLLERLSSPEEIESSYLDKLCNLLDELFEDIEMEMEAISLLESLLDAIEGFDSTCNEVRFVHTEEFTRFVVESYINHIQSRHVDYCDSYCWFEELVVSIAESCRIPFDLVDWFVKLDIAPYSVDSHLYVNSRTPLAGIASNATTSTEILASLSTHDEWTVRWRVGINTSSPKSALSELARDSSEMSDVIVAAVALNKSSDLETLRWIVENTNPDLRTLATRNEVCTDELRKLAIDIGVVKSPFSNWGSGLSGFN